LIQGSFDIDQLDLECGPFTGKLSNVLVLILLK